MYNIYSFILTLNILIHAPKRLFLRQIRFMDFVVWTTCDSLNLIKSRRTRSMEYLILLLILLILWLIGLMFFFRSLLWRQVRKSKYCSISCFRERNIATIKQLCFHSTNKCGNLGFKSECYVYFKNNIGFEDLKISSIYKT